MTIRFDLKTPCLHCPFRTDETAIRFSGRERATEIEESAYRNGFPCHLSAVDASEDDPDQSGYVFGKNTQHCAGFIIMALKDGNECGWPGIRNNEKLANKLAGQMNFDAPVYDSAQAFIDANSVKQERTRPPNPQKNKSNWMRYSVNQGDINKRN